MLCVYLILDFTYKPNYPNSNERHSCSFFLQKEHGQEIVAKNAVRGHCTAFLLRTAHTLSCLLCYILMFHFKLSVRGLELNTGRPACSIYVRSKNAMRCFHFPYYFLWAWLNIASALSPRKFMDSNSYRRGLKGLFIPFPLTLRFASRNCIFDPGL